MTRISILFLIGLICLLAACSAVSDDTLTDLSLKTLQPCAPPCWYGMELGKSSFEDFKATLLQLPFVDPNEISYYEDRDPEQPTVVRGSLDWRCVQPARDWCGSAFFIDGKWSGMYLPIKYQFAFSEIVETLGPPTEIAYLPSLAFTGPDYCRAQLYWQGTQLLVEGHILQPCHELGPSEATAKPNPDIRIIAVYYGSSKEDNITYRPWSGFAEAPWIFLNLIPGGLRMWLFFPLTLLVLIFFALLQMNHRVISIVSVPFAFVAIVPPTLYFAWSDICIPTILAMVVNTILCSGAYMLITKVIQVAATNISRSKDAVM